MIKELTWSGTRLVQPLLIVSGFALAIWKVEALFSAAILSQKSPATTVYVRAQSEETWAETIKDRMSDQRRKYHDDKRVLTQERSRDNSSRDDSQHVQDVMKTMKLDLEVRI